MIILPAIDMYDHKAVRLFKGDYNQMTVYSNDPISIAHKFKDAGAEWIHLVDLEGARDATTPNLDLAIKIVQNCGLKAEIGGGIRNEDTVKKYLDAGLDRVILGTAALNNRDFLEKMVSEYKQHIAVGVDIKNGMVATSGWLETSGVKYEDFCSDLEALGVSTIICTDISKDGAMKGTNLELYKKLNSSFNINTVASGGVSSIEDIKALRAINTYGAIIGKAYYTGAIDIAEALEAAK